MSVWRLLSLSGIRRKQCKNCGAKIGVSWFSSFVLLAFGTWTPVAGAIVGAAMASGITGGTVLIGGALGFVLSGALVAAVYFRVAKLTAT